MEENQNTDVEVEAEEISDEVLEASNQLASKLFDRAVEDAEDQDDVDTGAVIFAMFVTAVHFLAHCGWSPEELSKEALQHATEQLTYEENEDENGSGDETVN